MFYTTRRILLTGAYGTLAYEYDAVGNRTRKTVNGAETDYFYVPGTNNLDYATGAEPATYTYDANGNMISDGKYTYEYEAGGAPLPHVMTAMHETNIYPYTGNNPINFVDILGLEFIKEEEAQSIVGAAKEWKGTPYVTGGKTEKGADCSGSTWGIYQQAGFIYTYSPTATFSKNPRFKQAPDNIPQMGDIGLYPGHMVIYDPSAGDNRNVWSASHPGGRPYGPASSDWYKGNVQWYRYDKPQP